MKEIQILPNLRIQIIFIYILIITQFKSCFGQQNSQSQSYKLIQPNIITDLVQNYSSMTYQLDFTKNKMNFNRYIIIEINASNVQLFSKFTPCLNYDIDILKDEEFKNSGKYKCALQDNLKRIQQNQSYILVIDQQDPIYKTQKVIYLTIIYQLNQQQIAIPILQLSDPLKYNVFIYNFNSYPCYKDCTGNNGICDSTNGRCTCKPGYYDIDCGISLYPLQFDESSNSASFYIQASKIYFFQFKMSDIKKEINEDVVIIVKKFNSNSSLNIQIIVKSSLLPTDENNIFSSKMSTDEFTLPDINQLCQNFTTSQNSINQNTGGQSNNSTSLDCFAIISIKQLTQSESTIITYTKKLKKSSNDNIPINNNNNQNQKTQTNTQTNTQESESKESMNVTFIIIITCLGSALVIPITVRIIYVKCRKPTQPAQQQQNPVAVVASQNQIPVQAISDIANRIKSGLKSKTLNLKKRLLQDKLMPVTTYHSLKSSAISITNLDKVEHCQEKSKVKDGTNNQIKQENNTKENCNEKSQKQNQIDHSIFEKDQKSHCKLSNNNNDIERQLSKNNQSMSFTSVGNRQCCAICLTEFINEEQVRETICSHTFHIHCLGDWLNKHDSCPLCRQSFEIMHMIEYLTKQEHSKKTTYYEKNKILMQRDKVQATLLEKKDAIGDMSEEEFLKIFVYFLPKNHQEQNILITTQNDNQDKHSHNIITQQQVENTQIQNEQFEHTSLRQIQQDENIQPIQINTQKTIQNQQPSLFQILSPSNNSNKQKIPSSAIQNQIQSPKEKPLSQRNGVQSGIISPKQQKNQYFSRKQSNEIEHINKVEHSKINDISQDLQQTLCLTTAIYGESTFLQKKQSIVKNTPIDYSIQNSPRLEQSPNLGVISSQETTPKNQNNETAALDSSRGFNQQRQFNVSKHQVGMSKDFSMFDGNVSIRENSTSQHMFVVQNDDQSPVSLFNKFKQSQLDEIKEGQFFESLTDRTKEHHNKNHHQKYHQSNTDNDMESINQEESIQHNGQRNVVRRQQFLQNLQNQQSDIHQ